MTNAKSHLLSGFACIAISSLFAIVFSTLIKWLNMENGASVDNTITANTIIVYFLFIRGVMLYLGAGWIHVRTKQMPNPKTLISNHDFQLGLLIGAVSFGIALSLLTAIMHISQTQTMSFLYATPLLLMVVSALFFKKSLTIVQLLVMALGSAGLLSLMDTGAITTYDMVLGYGCAFLATILTAVYITLLKKQQNANRLMTMHTMGLSYIVCAIAFGIIANDFGYQTGYIYQIGDFFALLTWQHNVIFAIAVITGMLSNVLGQIGFSRSTPLSTIFGLYSGLIWAVCADYFVFGNTLAMGTFMGMLIIASLGVFCIYYDYSRKITPKDPSAVSVAQS